MLVSQMIQRYDIVLLQEVFGTAWCGEWRKVFSSTPNMQSVMGIKAKCKILDSGLVILSRYPIIDSSFTQFRSKSLSNAVIDRGFLYAEIKVGEKRVHVINTHLNPDETHYGIHSPAEYRRRQLQEILRFKKKVEGEKVKGEWVIGGDFNDDKLSEALRPMIVSNVMEATSHKRVSYASEDGGQPHCIDYLVTSRPQQYARVVHNLISDHYGVEAGMVL